MTDLINDTGEIHLPGEKTVRLRLVGETQTRLHVPTVEQARRAKAVGEATQNIGPYTEFSRPLRRPDSTGEMPRFIDPTLGMPLTGAELAVGYGRPSGPAIPPPPRPVPTPPPTPSDALTERVSLLEAIAPDNYRPDRYTGRHRDPRDRIAVAGESRWGWLSDAMEPVVDAVTPGPRASKMVLMIGAACVVWAAVTLAVLL